MSGQYEAVSDSDNTESWDDSNRKVTQMGCFGWRPRFLECLNNPPSFVVIFGLSNLFMVMSYGVLGLIIPTLETVFNLTSQQTGFILMANDISGTFAAILLANYCSARKARWISIGMWIIVLSALIPAASTLLAEYPVPQNATGYEDTGLCNASFGVPVEDSAGAYAVRNHKYWWLHVTGSVLQGIGGTPPGIAGSTYMDEIFTQKAFGFAISLLYIVSFLGYPLSLMVGSFFLTFYVTFDNPGNLTPDSKEWVGAWWLGLVVPSSLVLLLSTVLVLFPRQMPAAKKVLLHKIRKGITTAKEKKTELNRNFIELTKDAIPALKRIFKNKSLDFLVVGDCFLFLHIGVYNFIPKIYSLIYRISTDKLGYMIGVSNIIGFGGGLFCGGLLMTKKTWSPKKLQFILMVTSAISIPFSLGVLLYCPKNTYGGLDVGYTDTDTSITLESECNSRCLCTTAFYEPVCDNGVTYFSACYAGCDENNVTSGVYTNCSCTQSGEATKGDCGGLCMKRFYIAITLVTVSNFFLFSGFAAHAIVYQRIVSEVDRSLAQGIRQTATRALGTLPSPLLFGWILDKFCVIWRKTKDGTSGNCWIYDIDGLVLWFVVAQTTIKVLNFIFYFLCWLYFPHPDLSNVKLDRYELQVRAPDEASDENTCTNISVANGRTHLSVNGDNNNNTLDIPSSNGVNTIPVSPLLSPRLGLR